MLPPKHEAAEYTNEPFARYFKHKLSVDSTRTPLVKTNKLPPVQEEVLKTVSTQTPRRNSAKARVDTLSSERSKKQKRLPALPSLPKLTRNASPYKSSSFEGAKLGFNVSSVRDTSPDRYIFINKL